MSPPVRPRRRRRGGTTTVEAAFVLPVFLIFVFALFELCHIQMVSNMLKSSCRAAARYGATDGVSTEDAVAVLQAKMGAVMDPDLVTVLVKNADVFDDPDGTLPETSDDYDSMSDINLSDAEPLQLFLVRGSVNYNDVAILTLPWMGDITLTGQTIMRHE
ncbi:MAG: pilus assembly protein [Pirellulaceae bacterium]